MSSEQQSGSGSSSGTPRPPQPPLPGEDPNLVFTTSSRAGVNIQGQGDVQGDVVSVGEVVESAAAARERHKRKVTRYAVRLWLGLIGLGILLYFLLQYFLR